MALGIGKAAGWIGKRALSSNAFILGAGGVAATVGATSAILDRSGPYPELQEFAVGDPEALRYTMKAGLSTAISPRQRDLSGFGTANAYYGSPVNPQMVTPPGIGRATPVPGETVLGAYNMRRG